MLLANIAPIPTKASEATNDRLRFCDDRKCGSSGFSVHDRARRRRADELDRIFLGEGEIDEEFRIVDLNLEHLRFHRLLERQRKVQRQHRRLGIVIEPIIGRIVECILIFRPVHGGVGEVGETLERIDIDLGERLQFLAGELALGFGLDSHGRESREHVVEGPGMTHAGDRAVGGIEQVGLDRRPDVRMGLCLARRQDCRGGDEHSQAHQEERRSEPESRTSHRGSPISDPAMAGSCTSRGHDNFRPLSRRTRRPGQIAAVLNGGRERGLEMTARPLPTRRAPASASARRGGSGRASQAPGVGTEVPSRSAPCWRRSDNNRPGRRVGGAFGRALPPVRRRRQNASGLHRSAAAARDRRDACGRMTRPSEMPAQTAPVARLIEVSIGTNSLN